MDRLILVIGAVAIASAFGAFLGRKPGAPASNTHHVPNLVDRGDFARPEAQWLVVLFSSTTCNTCAGVWDRASVLESDDVVVQQLTVQQQPQLHDRYGIDGVPTLVVADRDGAVKRAFLGPVTAADLWAAIAEERD